MACLEMYNNNSTADPNSTATANYFSTAPPRISFSTDFADSSHGQHAATIPKSPLGASSAPSSSNFEFSVTNHSMMAADELFSQGRMLPFKADGGARKPPTTLREELLAGDDDDHDVALRPPKGSAPTRWKGFLGLRKAHIGSKKPDPKLPPSVATDQDAMHND